MKSISFSLTFLSTLALVACGQSSIDGEYVSTGGRVGIYEMDAMVVEQEADAETYFVQFIGEEETLSYSEVERDGSVLSINDKGFIMTVEFAGDEAIVGGGEATFEKTSN